MNIEEMLTLDFDRPNTAEHFNSEFEHKYKTPGLEARANFWIETVFKPLGYGKYINECKFSDTETVATGGVLYINIEHASKTKLAMAGYNKGHLYDPETFKPIGISRITPLDVSFSRRWVYPNIVAFDEVLTHEIVHEVVNFITQEKIKNGGLSKEDEKDFDSLEGHGKLWQSISNDVTNKVKEVMKDNPKFEKFIITRYGKTNTKYMAGKKYDKYWKNNGRVKKGLDPLSDEQFADIKNMPKEPRKKIDKKFELIFCYDNDKKMLGALAIKNFKNKCKKKYNENYANRVRSAGEGFSIIPARDEPYTGIGFIDNFHKVSPNITGYLFKRLEIKQSALESACETIDSNVRLFDLTADSAGREWLFIPAGDAVETNVVVNFKPAEELYNELMVDKIFAEGTNLNQLYGNDYNWVAAITRTFNFWDETDSNYYPSDLDDLLAMLEDIVKQDPSAYPNGLLTDALVRYIKYKKESLSESEYSFLSWGKNLAEDLHGWCDDAGELSWLMAFSTTMLNWIDKP